MISRKDQLVHENEELEREQKVRNDLVTLRLGKIADAEFKEKKRKEGRRLKMAAARQNYMTKLMTSKGFEDVMPTPDQSHWLHISDDE